MPPMWHRGATWRNTCGAPDPQNSRHHHQACFSPLRRLPYSPQALPARSNDSGSVHTELGRSHTGHGHAPMPPPMPTHGMGWAWVWAGHGCMRSEAGVAREGMLTSVGA